MANFSASASLYPLSRQREKGRVVASVRIDA